MRRRTRIVATLGPASCEEAQVRRILRAGADVVRLNFSHGTHAFHAGLIRTVRRVSADLGRPVAILQDLPGPKMRVGLVQDDAVRLRPGTRVQLAEDHQTGTAERLSVDTAGALDGVRPGQRVLLADGLIELRVLSRSNGHVNCRVVQGGLVRSRQGLHLTGRQRGLQAFTHRDRRDLRFGLAHGVDAVALSFVRDRSDVLAARRALAGQRHPPLLIAKIERAEALDKLDAILDAADGVMVARGDLGVDLGVENVPLAQKAIIERAREKQRFVITATQMFESMIERPNPTRAEVSDAANAVLEGTDGLMLSAETAIGRYAPQAVAALARVAGRVESQGVLQGPADLPSEKEDVSLATARAARMAARAVRAAAVLAFTDSGRTARHVSSQRPRRPIYAFTSHASTWRQLSLSWGLTPLLMKRARSIESMIASAERELLAQRLVRPGSIVVVVCGERVQAGATNTVRIHTLGARQARGASNQRASASP